VLNSSLLLRKSPSHQRTSSR